MSSNKKVLKLRQEILKANTQLKQLQDSGQLEYSDDANKKYNKILIQKAIDKKKLNETKHSFLHNFFKKFSHKGERLICDYFKS